MQYIFGRTDFQFHNTCVTLGKFDGVHKGHQLLFSYLKSYKEKGLTSVMFTFDYHPGNLFSDKEMNLIYTEEEKHRVLNHNGPDVLISYPFTKASASMEAEDFVKNVLMKQLDAKVIVVGTDYRFGKNRRGDIAMLDSFSKEYGFKLIVCEKLLYKNQVISSTRIREEIKNGSMADVNAMLGRPFGIFGTVVHGEQIGQTIGIPTVNLIPGKHKLLPPNGVYVSRVKIDGKIYDAITNIGAKPTVSDSGIINVESHLIDFVGNLYGKEAEVLLYQFQRKEQKFASLDELKQAVGKDLLAAKEYFRKEDQNCYDDSFGCEKH